MASPQTLMIILLAFVSFLSLAAADPTAYQLLDQFGFPKGILPEGVQSYLLRPDGTFEVFLGGDCEFKVQGYLLRYKRRFRGTVEAGVLRGLTGVSVKVLFFWVGIDEVVSGGGELKFYVGLVSASFAVSKFVECPRCRRRVDCSDSARVSDS